MTSPAIDSLILLIQDPTTGYEFERIRGAPNLNTPERKLVRAVLKDGLTTFTENLEATTNRRILLGMEAREWIFGEPDNPKWPFTFENCCETLGIDPGAIRRDCRRIQERKKNNP